MYKFLLKKTLVYSVIVILIGTSIVSAIDTISENSFKEISKLSLNDGLIGYWSFDYENAEDESINNNNGILNGPTVVEGISGKAFNFDGINDYIEVTNTDDYKFTNQDITFTAWVQIADNSDRYHCFMSIADSVTQYGYPKINLGKSRSGFEDGRIYFQLQTTAEDTIVFSKEDGNTLPKNQWIFLTGVIDYPDSIKLYINGEIQAIDYLINFDMSDAFLLELDFGSTPYPGYDWEYGRHKGLIDELRIYNRALSDDEIMELYDNPGGFITTIMFGRIINVNTSVGNIITFQAKKLRWIRFSPFQFVTFKSGEKIKISDDYRGLLKEKFLFGLFRAYF